MVKKHKGGRRQILQLEDKKSSRSEWEPTSTAALNKEATPLDSQVADFFKEIDALTVNDHDNEGNPEAASASNDVASCSKEQDTDDSIVQEQPEKSHSNQNVLQSEDFGSSCSWQEICDRNTGYVYYWNTDTNEVTWECPEEYIMYLKSRKSVDGEDFSQSNRNSHENPKKAKRKKDPPKPPEGAIIPISYFGNSSSDESSDEEISNGLNISFPHLNHKIESKTSAPSKESTIKKDDCRINENNGEPVETMGPHLPADHQISKMVSSASKNSFLCKEAETSSKNEVDEYLEIGAQLASNSGIGISKNSDCNTVSDSSSKCSNVIDSIKNGPELASSSTYEEPWEVSLMNIEKKLKGLDQDIGEESPDSTVRKVDTSSENSMPCQTTNWTAGIRGVVEYDDFTDEEEEMSSSNISSSKQESDKTCKTVSAGYNKVKDWSIQLDDQRKYDSIKSEVSQSESQRNFPKRKFLCKTDEYVDTNFKKSKQKVDIDKLFINYSNSHKYGFGFSRQEQLNIESEFFCSTSGYNQLIASKGSRDCKTINFVKSDHVFDLGTLNNNISNDNFSQSKPDELDKNNSTDNICTPGPSRLNGFKEDSDSKTVLNESNNVTNDDCLSKVKEVITSKSINGKLKYNLNSDVSCENEESLSEHKNASSSKTNDASKVEEDIDEIDRQLSEAFEAKKAENASSKPSSSFSSVCSEKKRIETDSTVFTKPVTESAKIALDILNIRSLSDDIISLSSVLIDKLSFLISNHSTLTSLSSLLIQIQTRLIDWQAGSLESRYFMSRLQEVQQYLQHYEVGAVSGDWICQWDRENKRYFYMNTRTQQSQWTYPEELCGKENSWMPSSTESASASASSDVSRERDELQTVSSSVPEGQFQNKSFSVESKGISTKKYSDSSSLWISESSPPPPPPGVDSPPPPPPQSPPPDSPPPPPPDSTEVEDLLEDMDIENSDDSNQPLIVTNSRGDTPSDALTPYSKFPLPSPERSVETLPSASITNAVSSTSLSGFEDMNIVLKSPQLVTTSHDTFDTVDSVNMHWSISQPSCSTDIVNSFDSESEMNFMLNSKLHNPDKDSDANASSSSRSCDINASTISSSRSCDINASSSSSSKNCDFNASSSSSRSCDVNTSSSSTRSYDVNASSSTNRNYICSNEVTTYRKPCGPYPPTLTVVSASTTTSSRKEKKKAKLSSGLALKKKNIPSLVEKWQKN